MKKPRLIRGFSEMLAGHILAGRPVHSLLTRPQSRISDVDEGFIS